MQYNLIYLHQVTGCEFSGSISSLLFPPAIWFSGVIPILLAMFSWGWSQVGSHVSRGNNDYPASGKLLSLSFYHPTSLSTDQLITWYFFFSFFWYGLFQLEFLLLTWELKRKPLLRQVQAHISFIAGSRLLTEISSSLCCVMAWNERIKSQG